MFSPEEIIQLIQKNAMVHTWVTNARTYRMEMAALVWGEKYKARIEKIEHIEANDLRVLARRRYTRPVKDVFKNILAPTSNVFSATGGGKEYNLKNIPENMAVNFYKKIADFSGGISIERWLETYWINDLYVVDPNGIIFLEYLNDTDNGEIWPTYKSINNIRTYKSNGQLIEWILFEPKVLKDGSTLWRFVDSVNDVVVIQNGNSFNIDQDRSFKHVFGVVPAIINSNIQTLGTELRLSPLDSIKEMMDEYMRDQGILSMFKFLHGFPLQYGPKQECPICKGSGIRGDGVNCGCNNGYISKNDVTDKIEYQFDPRKDQPFIPNKDFIGYLTPPLDIWDKYEKVLKNTQMWANEVIWGTKESEVKDQTAKGTELNLQPKVTALCKWSSVAERVEQSITEMLANWAFPTKPKDEKISLITYGRNYILTPASALLEQYSEGKEKGLPVTVLDKQLVEYLTAKYKNNPTTLAEELIKVQVEPFVHYTLSEVNEAFGNEERQKKMLFTDWWETIDRSRLMGVADEVVTQLSAEFENWVKEVSPQNNIANENG